MKKLNFQWKVQRLAILNFIMGCFFMLVSCKSSVKNAQNPAIAKEKSKVLITVNLAPEIEQELFFETITGECKKQGSVLIVRRDELFKDERNEACLLDIDILRLGEGNMFNFGKRLSVLKVSLSYIDFLNSSQCPKHQTFEEYVEMQDKVQTTQKVIRAFHEIMNDFLSDYRRQYPTQSQIQFIIQEPLILENNT